jgi:hypothetical protein
MKKIAIAIAALVILVGFIGWNVWHAVYEPVTARPNLVEQGRQQLHDQLEHSETREAEIEKMDWDSITLLRGLIQAHQHRVDQLKGNSQAAEIVAHDNDAITRINQRIKDLETQQAARPPAESIDGLSPPAQSPETGAPTAIPAPKASPLTQPARPPHTTQPAPQPSTPPATQPSNPAPNR